MNEVIKEYAGHIQNYTYEKVCGASGTDFPTEYEIPHENTGTLKNQNGVGCCVAEVIAQLSEEFNRRQYGVQEEFSEGYIYGLFRDDNSRSEGMIVRKALSYWNKLGSVQRKYFDILKEMPTMRDIVKKYPDLQTYADKHKISGYVEINYADSERKDREIKDALTKYNYGLVAVVDNFSMGESHCILLTGWDDTTKKYKFKNSWGATYGKDGYSEIAKDRVNEVYLPLFSSISLPFSDVSPEAWYYDAVKSVYFADLMNGTTNDTFEPSKTLTRAEFAAVMQRLTKEIDKRLDLINRALQDK